MSVMATPPIDKQPSTFRGHLMRVLPLLTVLPGTHLPLIASWARHFSAGPDQGQRVDALRRARRRAEAEIHAALTRLATEFDLPNDDVSDAKCRVADALDELTGEVERDLAGEIEHADQY